MITSDETQVQQIEKLQKLYVGTDIEPGITVVDVACTKYGDVYILCLLRDNPVHKFATWSFYEPTMQRTSGHYCLTLAQAHLDLWDRAIVTHHPITDKSLQW